MAPRAKKPQISACLILYNEEATIRECLDKIRGVVDEIIIIHDGPCQDRTLDICRTYGAKIFVRPRIGMCDPHRAFAFKACNGEWILNIDADEHLSKELGKAMRTLVQNAECDAFAFRWPMLTDRGWIEYGHKPFLFRKTKVQVIGFPHRIPFTSGKMCTSDLAVEHRPKRHIFTPGYYEKQAGWAKVHAQWCWKEFRTIPTFHIAEKDWPESFKKKRKLSFLYPFVGAAVFLNNYLIRGRIFKGYVGWRQTMIEASYNYNLYRQIWLQRPRAITL